MQVNIYVKDQLYKTVDVPHPEKYNVSDMIKIVHADRDAGLIPGHNEGDKLPIRLEAVK